MIDDAKRRLKINIQRILNIERCALDLDDVLGCTFEELCEHLEKRFNPRMKWENYGRGGWELDHIIPRAAFDCRDPEQAKDCFQFTNLQPLWKSENILKGSSGYRRPKSRGIAFISIKNVPIATVNAFRGLCYTNGLTLREGILKLIQQAICQASLPGV